MGAELLTVACLSAFCFYSLLLESTAYKFGNVMGEHPAMN